ncbi:hypothetical protein LZD49_07185 [Dyadobacter sp. CY261]|uniref:hypothetical protein n=1 Tax=Dyadobacter sp. CY261 TaxID=2907203 RepID=UPI001F313133|nr:hypothetical protein [Dyadobacter sp. CY261]MCF0070249.1 hypothetical protein [Dyadobacter sp. CY261]
MSTEYLQISKSNAIKAFESADRAGKKLLKDLLGEVALSQKITDRVKSYEDACLIKGIKPKTIEDFSFLEDQAEYMFAVHQDDVINEVLNEGWNPDWSDDDQYKYYPYFYWDENAAGGSGFSFRGVGYDYSFSGVGSRRVFKTSELATYSGKQFIEIHRIIHNPRQK